MAPLISTVVLTRDGRPYLETCLASLAAQSYPAVEVTLVDNASSDGSAQWVREHFPAVRVIASPINRAFIANNLGMAAARGKYVVLLNNDTRADPDFVR